MVAGRQNLSLRSEYFLFFPNSLSRAVCDSFQATPGRERFSFLWLLGGVEDNAILELVFQQ